MQRTFDAAFAELLSSSNAQMAVSQSVGLCLMQNARSGRIASMRAVLEGIDMASRFSLQVARWRGHANFWHSLLYKTAIVS